MKQTHHNNRQDMTGFLDKEWIEIEHSSRLVRDDPSHVPIFARVEEFYDDPYLDYDCKQEEKQIDTKCFLGLFSSLTSKLFQSQLNALAPPQPPPYMPVLTRHRVNTNSVALRRASKNNKLPFFSATSSHDSTMTPRQEEDQHAGPKNHSWQTLEYVSPCCLGNRVDAFEPGATLQENVAVPPPPPLHPPPPPPMNQLHSPPTKGNLSYYSSVDLKNSIVETKHEVSLPTIYEAAGSVY